MIEIGGGPFVFSAAHAGLHEGEFEPLHGHTFSVTARLIGGLDEAGMVVDFHLVKDALAAVIAPLRRRTLMPTRPLGGSCWREDDQIFIECGLKRYSLPVQDVVLLPVVNTTTEAIAAYLLQQFLTRIDDDLRIERVELTLSEAPDTAATAAADVPSAEHSVAATSSCETGPRR
ncbi:6-pyruvoyl trahydropterin synthase family protein [Actinomadura barringtoniae]|nr:6-carboxytetrahydropterin synthase [Actinomadura barringtoniae]